MNLETLIETAERINYTETRGIQALNKILEPMSKITSLEIKNENLENVCRILRMKWIGFASTVMTDIVVVHRVRLRIFDINDLSKKFIHSFIMYQNRNMIYYGDAIENCHYFEIRKKNLHGLSFPIIFIEAILKNNKQTLDCILNDDKFVNWDEHSGDTITKKYNIEEFVPNFSESKNISISIDVDIYDPENTEITFEL